MNISKSNVKPVFQSPYINVVDLEYAPGAHYLDATRRNIDDIVAAKSDQEFMNLKPDAVTCIVILNGGSNPELLLSDEYRYPTGQFILSPPAGLIDSRDKNDPNAIIGTAIREVQEETGLDLFKLEYRVEVINRTVFSSPGMTDESNALVSIIIDSEIDDSTLSHEGACGSECFSNFHRLDMKDARSIYKNGRDSKNRFYSVYTWVALVYFISGLWKED